MMPTNKNRIHYILLELKLKQLSVSFWLNIL